MIALDTNLLVYAHREDSRHHPIAVRVLAELLNSASPWAIPWQCVHEFFAVVTHPRIFRPPTPPKLALTTVAGWLRSPSLQVLNEGPGYFPLLETLLMEGAIVGPQVHDARIAAVCLDHGVRELWTAGRDFSKYPGLRARNPLLG